MLPKIKLSDTVDILADKTKGVFYALQAVGLTGIDLTQYEQLDHIYYLEHSGEKYISRYYQTMLSKNKTISDIANDLKAFYYDKWKKMYDALTAEYNPIHNYDMNEHEEVNSKIKGSSSTKKYAFNTASDSPVGDYDVGTESSGSKDDNYRDLHRYGNIGVTTSAQMVGQELELRTHKFYDIMMNDIDTMLCLKIY